MIVVSHEVIENHILKKLPQKLQTSILPIEWKVKKTFKKISLYLWQVSFSISEKKTFSHVIKAAKTAKLFQAPCICGEV